MQMRSEKAVIPSLIQKKNSVNKRRFYFKASNVILGLIFPVTLLIVWEVAGAMGF